MKRFVLRHESQRYENYLEEILSEFQTLNSINIKKIKKFRTEKKANKYINKHKRLLSRYKVVPLSDIKGVNHDSKSDNE